MKAIVKNKAISSQEISVIELINKHFWKSKIGPILAFVIPIFLMTIYRILSKDKILLFASGMPAYFSFSILPLAFISLPQMMVEFKTSIILRKISNSKISAFKYILLVLSYNLVMLIGSTTIIVILCAIFLNIDAHKIFNNINWGEFVYAILIIFICSLAIGGLLGILINRINLVQVVGFCLVMISTTFSGQFIPISVLYSSQAIHYVSLISPISYSLNLLNVVLLPKTRDEILTLYLTIGVVPGSDLDSKIIQIINYDFNGIFDFKHTFKMMSCSILKVVNPDDGSEIRHISDFEITSIYASWQNVLNIFMPFVVTGASLVWSTKKFKWTSR